MKRNDNFEIYNFCVKFEITDLEQRFFHRDDVNSLNYFRSFTFPKAAKIAFSPRARNFTSLLPFISSDFIKYILHFADLS